MWIAGSTNISIIDLRITCQCQQFHLHWQLIALFWGIWLARWLFNWLFLFTLCSWPGQMPILITVHHEVVTLHFCTKFRFGYSNSQGSCQQSRLSLLFPSILAVFTIISKDACGSQQHIDKALNPLYREVHSVWKSGLVTGKRPGLDWTKTD